MALGLGALGFLAGASNAVQNKYEAEAEARVRQEERDAAKEQMQLQYDLTLRNDQAAAMLDYGLQKDIAQYTHGFDMEKIREQYQLQGKNQVDLARLNSDLQKDLISVEAAHEIAGYAFKADLDNKLQIARDNNSFQLEKKLLGIQNEFSLGKMGLQQSYQMAIRAYEYELARAQSEQEKDDLQNMLDILNTQASEAAQLGNPIVLPAGYQGYNMDGKPTSSLSLGGAGLSESGQQQFLEGVDTEKAVFFYEDRHGNNSYIPGVDTEVRTKPADRINQRYVNVLTNLGDELWWHIENNSPALDKIRQELVTNIDKSELRKSIELQQGANAQGLAIQNPVRAFELRTLITRDGRYDAASAKWFAENILGPSLGMSEEAIKYALGQPEEVELGYDSRTDTFLAPPAASYAWATTFNFDGTGKAKLNPEIRDATLALAREANLSVAVTLSTFSKFDNPMAALKATAADRPTIQALLDDGYPTPAFNDAIAKKVKDNGLSAEEGIALVRLYLDDNPYRQAQSFIIEGDVAKPQFNKRMKDLYGIDKEQARAKAVAARASIRVSEQMLEIRRTFEGVKAGRIGDLRLTLAGMGELVQDFRVLTRQMSDISTYDPSAEATGRIYADLEKINSLEQELVALANNPELTDVNRLQSVFNMLGETLAYNQAAVAQGGAQGRDISDNDVLNWKRKLGFEGTFIYTPGVEANLENLLNENRQIEEIYSAYAAAQTETDFRAVFMYEEAVGIVPMDYASWQDDAPNRYSGAEIDEGGFGRSGTVTYNVNGEQRTFPLN